MVDGSVEGQSIVVTGAASGIGAAVARQLAQGGAKVTIADLDAEGAERASASAPGSAWVAADVSTPEGVRAYVDAALERFGALDGAHLNAAYPGIVSPLAHIPLDEYDRVMTVNVRSVFLGMQAVIRQLTDGGRGGSIVATSSALGLYGGQRMAPYSASKHAVIGLVKSAALEYTRVGIRINALCPGFTDTRMMADTEQRLGKSMSIEQARERLFLAIPSGRYGTPAELAAMVVWLLGGASSYVSGAVFAVDGGLAAGRHSGPTELSAPET
jgi:NAD(P)-dependent dehydrogenase (short-subunit alcohol dehydrogenase family)